MTIVRRFAGHVLREAPPGEGIAAIQVAVIGAVSDHVSASGLSRSGQREAGDNLERFAAAERPPAGQSVGREVRVPVAERPERRPEVALRALVVERAVDVGHEQRVA